MPPDRRDRNPFLRRLTEYFSGDKDPSENNRERQIANLIKLGYHAQLGLTEAQYRKYIPYLQPKPPSFEGRFEYPVLVDPMVLASRQLELLHIKPDLSEADLAKFSLAEADRKDIPTNPYQIWIHIKRQGEPMGLDDLDWDEDALTIPEGAAFVRQFSSKLYVNERISAYGISLLGTRYSTPDNFQHLSIHYTPDAFNPSGWSVRLNKSDLGIITVTRGRLG